jgi:hypothetical protein
MGNTLFVLPRLIVCNVWKQTRASCVGHTSKIERERG